MTRTCGHPLPDGSSEGKRRLAGAAERRSMRVTLLRSAQNPEVSPAAAPTWPPKPARDIAPQVTGLLPRLVRTSTAHAAPRSGQREKAAESPAPARARPRVARRTSPPGRPPPAAPRPIAGLSSGPGIGLVAPAPPSGTPQAPSLDVRAPVACVSPGDRLRCMHAASPPREDRGSTNSCTRYTADCGPSSGVASLDRHAEGVLRILLALRATPTPSPQRPGGSRGRRQVDLDHAAAEDLFHSAHCVRHAGVSRSVCRRLFVRECSEPFGGIIWIPEYLSSWQRIALICAFLTVAEARSTGLLSR